MDRTAETRILGEIASDIGGSVGTLSEAPLTGFLAMIGTKYSGELMWVGRAVNGWGGEHWTPEQLNRAEEVEAFVNTILKSVSGGSGGSSNCPMSWVADCWRRKPPKDWEGERWYSTSYSAFWRTAKGVLHGLGLRDVNQGDWPSNLVWSNLYKVAPAKGGNPGSRLRGAQQEKCQELLLHEVDTFRPKRLVFATGSDWVSGFLEARRFGSRPVSGSERYVRRTGSINYDDGARGVYIVADHPMLTDESIWTKEVLDALSGGGTRE